jgi:LysM repeat protein
MKRLCFVLLMGLYALAANSQDKTFIVNGATPNLYLLHTVEAKENLFIIGRNYNQGAKTIAAANGITTQSVIRVGQKIKIPLTAANFSQDGKKGADDVFVPVYHVLGDKEWLYRVSVTHNKVPVELIEKWNGVLNSNVQKGMKLVIGFLKVKQGQSSLAKEENEKIVKVEDDPGKDPATPIKEDAPPVAPPVAEKKPVVAPANPVVKTEPVQQPALGEGFFKKDYMIRNTITSTGTCAIFKTVSGWQDGKYYALVNNVPTGTIVKVTNPATGKIIYAKVLGDIPEIKGSEGLLIRISNAAASALGATEEKFTVELSYGK